MARELGALIVGAGRVSTAHARAIEQTEGVKLVGIADVAKDRADAFAAKHGCLAFEDYKKALERPDVDIMMVALPHHLHVSATLDACAAGKHLFIEKPMADSVEECDQMIAAAEKAHVQLFVAHTQRFFNATIKAKELVWGGSIGQPVFATDTWYKPFAIETRPPWMLDRALGGGMWLMDGAHQIDRTCWVMDSDIVAVKAYIGNDYHRVKTDDVELAMLQLRNGKYVSIIHTGYAKRGVNKCEVEIPCTDGQVLFDSYSNRLFIDKDHQYEQIEVERNDPFAAELKNLVGAINGRERLRVTPQWGKHIVDVLEACEESSRTGREVMVKSRGLEVPVAR